MHSLFIGPVVFFLISLSGQLPDLWKGGEYVGVYYRFSEFCRSRCNFLLHLQMAGWDRKQKIADQPRHWKRRLREQSPFFWVRWLITFLAIYNIANFSFFSSSTFIIIANPSKNKQTVISSVYCLFFSKESWDWLWLRIILQGIKTEFVFFFRNFYMKSNYILHVTKISDLQSQA